MPIQRETDVPVPHNARHRSRRNSYRFHEMEVGDSIFAPGAVKNLMHSRIYGAIRHYAYRHPPFAFAARRYPDGVRVWRVEDHDTTPDWLK